MDKARSVYYRSHCLECDVYSSKYWEPRDCPTSHAEGEDWA